MRTLLFLLVVFLLVRGDDGNNGGTGRKDGDGVHDGNVGDRDVQSQDNDGELVIVNTGANPRDKFFFRIATKDEGLKISVESQVIDPAFRDRQRFTVFFDAVAQYSGGALFNQSNVVSTYKLSEKKFGPFVKTQVGAKYIVYASTLDGVFNSSFEFSGKPFPTGTTTLTPADLKININIRNFPYVGNTTNDRLAVLVHGKAKITFVNTTTMDPKGRVVYNGGSAFSWVPTAVADGATVNVVNSPATFYDNDADNEDQRKYFGIAFSIAADRPNVVLWDPTVSASTYTSSVVLLAANFLLVAFALVF